MVKEQVALVLDQANNSSISSQDGQDVAGYSQIPVAYRKFKVRRIMNVSPADWETTASATMKVAAVQGISHHAPANQVVSGHGYEQEFLEFEAPLKETLENIMGEVMVDDNRIFSYRKIKSDSTASLIDIPQGDKKMQIVIPSEALIIKSEVDQVIDLVVVEKAQAQESNLINSPSENNAAAVQVPLNVVEFKPKQESDNLEDNKYLKIVDDFKKAA